MGWVNRRALRPWNRGDPCVKCTCSLEGLDSLGRLPATPANTACSIARQCPRRITESASGGIRLSGGSRQAIRMMCPGQRWQRCPGSRPVPQWEPVSELAQASASSSAAILVAALSTASTDAVTMFACRPTPNRDPGTPGRVASTMATAIASAPAPRLRSS